MLSPTCRIPITVRPSLWLQPIFDAEGQALIPSSIGAGESMTVDDPIKVLIKPNRTPPLVGSRFLEQDTLLLSAHMPWLNREMPNFEYSRTVTIQYPVELRGFNFLKTMARGSASRVAFEVCRLVSLLTSYAKNSFEVYNKSTKALGTTTPSTRTVEVCSSFPIDCGSLLSPLNEWANEVTKDVASAAPTIGTSSSQAIRIRSDADSYRHVEISMGLYLRDPVHEDDIGVVVEKKLVQQIKLRVQISSLYNHNPQSRFLLVTNVESTGTRVQAIQNFINNNLEMEVDRWNVSLYGGFDQPEEEGEDSPKNMITRYHGNSIIFLGDPFQFFGAGERDIAEICNVRTLAQASLHGTCYYFIGSAGHSAFQRLAERLVFPMPYSMANITQSLPDSQKFNSTRDLIESINESRSISDPGFDAYTVPVQGKWYRLGRANPNSEAKKLARYLRQQFPQERFLVAPMAERIDGQESTGFCTTQIQSKKSKRSKRNLGRLSILQGGSHEVSVIATEPRSNTSHLLDAYEKFMLVKTLPVLTRIDILWTHAGIGTAGVQDEDSMNAFTYIFLSVLTDLNLEIQKFLYKARWPNKVKCSNPTQESRSFLGIHLPTLFKLLNHQRAKTLIWSSDHIVELLQHAEASCLSPEETAYCTRHPASSPPASQAPSGYSALEY